MSTHISRMVAERLLSIRTFTIYLAGFSIFATLATPVHPVRCWWNSFWSANKRLLYYSNQLFMPSDVWHLQRDGELFKIEKDTWQDKKFISWIPKLPFLVLLSCPMGDFFVLLFKQDWDVWCPQNLFSLRVSVMCDEKSRSDQYSNYILISLAIGMEQ